MKVYCTVNFKKDIENLIGLLIFRFNLNLITLAINYEIPKLRRKNKITFHGSLAENDCQLTLLKKGSHLSLLYETDAAARYGFHSANLPNNLVVTFIPSNFILYLRTLQLGSSLSATAGGPGTTPPSFCGLLHVFNINLLLATMRINNSVEKKSRCKQSKADIYVECKLQ